jgi:hypothetical protein
LEPILSDSHGTITATWKDDPQALMRFQIRGNGNVEVFEANRGAQQKGSGGEMLASALRGAGAAKPRTITLYDIVNPPTLSAIKAGTPFAETVIGKMVTKTVEELGGKVESMDFYGQRKDVGREFQYNAFIKVTYPNNQQPN